MLREAGLVDVGADAYQVIAGDAAMRHLLRANIAQVADQLVAQELNTRAEIEHYLTILDEGNVEPSTPLLVSAWGRRPSVA